MSGLGPLEFRKRGPVSAMVIVPLFGALSLFGATRYLAGTDTYDLVLGGVLLLVTAALAALSWLMISMRWEFHRDGVVWHRFGKATTLRYAEVRELGYLEVGGGGPDQWKLTLASPRTRVNVALQPDLKREQDLPALYARLLDLVTDNLRRKLRGGIRWGDHVLLAEALVTADGTRVPLDGRLELRTRQAMHETLWLDELQVFSAGRLVATLWPGQPNFQVGLRLLEELLGTKAAAGRTP